MISIDLLEVLLRTVPQYLLFGGVSLYILSWVNKNKKFGMGADGAFIVIGITALVVMMSGMIPSPKAEGLVQVHIEAVIRMLTTLTILGAFSIINLGIKFFGKKDSAILSVVVFLFALFIFFQSTKLSKVKFELNQTAVEVLAE